MGFISIVLSGLINLRNLVSQVHSWSRYAIHVIFWRDEII